METVLLHSCCAPCSSAIIEWMLSHEMRPIIYFFNPNIFPLTEYEKRKAELWRHAQSLGLQVIDGDWDHEAWRAQVKGLEHCPERGDRCQVCFNMRLLAAAKKAQSLGIERFTTSLASSRWKSLDQVNRAGFAAAEVTHGVTYWDKNWRKDGLQERRNQLLKIHAFYNQTWCGCEFSFAQMKAKQAEREAQAQH